MSLSRVAGLLLPHLAGVVVEGIEVCGGRLVLHVRDGTGPLPCPGCGQLSGVLHSWYRRRLADPAAGGQPVRIWLMARRLACGNPGCARKTFAAQVEGLTCRYARRTPLLTRVLQTVAVALAGRAGSRLAAALGITVSRVTLLRLVMAMPDPPAGEVTEAGIDDFAFRRGRAYGTIVVNAATGQVIDLLPDRETGTVREWLAARPQIRVICRDRAAGYGQAAREGAPQAVQVADRWHLWHNLAGHAAAAISRQRAELAALAPAPAPVTSQEQVTAVITARWEQVQALRAQGKDLPAAMTALGLGKGTARRYWHAASPATLLAAPATSALDPWKPWLRQRWEQGTTSIKVLHREITAQGYTGAYQTTYRWLTRYRLAAPAPPPAPPTHHQAARLILADPAALDRDQQALRTAILDRCPAISALTSHIAAFAKILTGRHGDQLSPWISTVDADPAWPELHSFTHGLRQDIHAVHSALTLPWNSGNAEGNVAKLKLTKRQMYGRASYPLLRKRVLLLSAQPP